jgi:Exonuclease
MAPSAGVSERSISKTPISVVDIETTGLYPGGDRVIELAVVRIEPNEAPRLVLDTLINPKRRVAATEIHGITDADVDDAPPFEEIAGNVATALAGSVFASYNVYFDAKFLQEELSRVGVSHFPPHMCLMYLRPMLGLGKKCSLGDACRAHGIAQSVTHQAAADALVGASLWRHYSDALTSRRVDTFGDLAKLKDYKFIRSFSEDPLSSADAAKLRVASRLKSRSGLADVGRREAAATRETTPTMEYWDALNAALADLTLTTEEVEYLNAKQQVLRLPDEQIRWLHGRAFSNLLAEASQDHAITNDEVESLSRISAALRILGWAPGDPLSAEIGSRPADPIREEKKPGGWDWLRFWK